MREQMLALKAGEIAFREEPTLQQYLQMAEMAGTQWPEHRTRLLDAARQAPWNADPQGLIRIFLHEHLFNDAIAVLKTTTSYALSRQFRLLVTFSADRTRPLRTSRTKYTVSFPLSGWMPSMERMMVPCSLACACH